MGIGLSGMISGLDTDAIVNAMLTGQNSKKQKIDNKITLNKWTTTAWADLNKKIYSFYTEQASKLRLQSTYQTKSAKSSNEDVVKVTSSVKGPIGSHKVVVKAVAASQYVTGAKLSGTYTSESRMAALDNSLSGQTITIKNKVGTADETVSELTIDNNTRVSDFLSFCKSAGINANFDTGQSRFFFSSIDSGTENAFTITSSKENGALTALKANVKGVLSEAEIEGLTDEDKALYDSSIETIMGANADDLSAVLSAGFDPDAEGVSEEQQALYSALLTVESLIPVTEYDIPDDATPEEIAEINTLRDEAAAAAEERRFDFEQKVSALLNYSGDLTEGGNLAGIGLTRDVDGMDLSESGIGSMVMKSAKDATIELDGATMTSGSNTIVANGMTLNIEKTSFNETTGEYEEINVNIGKNTEETYKIIKDALTAYNELVDEMSKLYYAESARKYEPLTDEQKEAMSDDDIKNWEDKIKSALLRRDSTLGGIMSAMRTSLQSTYKDADGKEYSLSTFGIVTGTYTEYGKLHICGDADDSVYAANTDRLQKALDEDPDKVMEALSGIFSNLYTTLSDKCAKTSVSSALTFYNDKQYNTNLQKYEKELDSIEDTIATLQDRYYKQFTAMEKALSTLQSQTNSLAQMLGTNTNQN